MQITNIALDRIVEIENSNNQYIPSEIYWENDYFYDFVGVTKLENEKIGIEIELDLEQVPYIRTKPIHGSQKGPTLINDRCIISIQVIPNYEIMKMLLSFGDSVKIISPESFKLKMISNLRTSLAKYKKEDD
jgi:predicted DNA-binding transcriptional regulator YafY